MRNLLTVLFMCFSQFVTGQVGVKLSVPSTSTHTALKSFRTHSAVQTINLMEKYSVAISEEDQLKMTLVENPMGIFCKLDAGMDQKLPFKMRFRLGEYYYNDVKEYGQIEMRSDTKTSSY